MSYFQSKAGRLISCVIYLLAAIGTAGIMFAMMSLPKSGSFIPGDISFIGSLLLLVAAVTALCRFRGTGYISLAGVLIVWVPYFWLFITNGGRGGPLPLLEISLLFVLSVAYPIASIIGAKRAHA